MEDVIKKLNELNPGKNVLSVFDDAFNDYGTIHRDFRSIC